MKLTRRQALATLGGSALALRARAAEPGPEFTAGPFQNTRESLKDYVVPEWFRDAKFGIWAHWGPQSAAEWGDWYARNMYIEGHRQYKYHVQKYGHPSKFGFKDVIPTWKAERWEPEHLMSLYKKAGAKYFVSMGVHHDNFDLWNSRHNKWNAVNMGPRRDVVGTWAKAARKEGLRFGVSEHLGPSYNWFMTSHGADKTGPLAGVPYDGADPKLAEYYHPAHAVPKDLWDQASAPPEWKREWFSRIKDVLDQYEPDLLYTDGPIFYEEFGLGITAHLYNMSAKKHHGKVETVYANKGKADCAKGVCLLDLERGVVEKIWDTPWQTDTCIGDWHYNRETYDNNKYKTAKTVVDLLVDIVSRNGNLLLNFPLPNNGMLDDKELVVLDGVTRWMAVNSEGIYGTRPWKVYGSAENTAQSDQSRSDHHAAGAFNERNRKQLGPTDVRYVTKGKDIYAFSMGWGSPQVVFPELGTSSALQPPKVTNVKLLGAGPKVKWTQASDGLKIDLPAEKPCDHAICLKVTHA